MFISLFLFLHEFIKDGDFMNRKERKRTIYDFCIKMMKRYMYDLDHEIEFEYYYQKLNEKYEEIYNHRHWRYIWL